MQQPKARARGYSSSAFGSIPALSIDEAAPDATGEAFLVCDARLEVAETVALQANTVMRANTYQSLTARATGEAQPVRGAGDLREIEALTRNLGGSGTGASGIDIYDEGVLIAPAVTRLDFKGTSVEARKTTTGAVVYSPVPTYASHFDTQDGVTDASVSESATVARFVAAPTTEGNPFQSNGFGGDLSTHPTTRSSTRVFSVDEFFSLDDSNTTITVTVSNDDGDIRSLTTEPITASGGISDGIINISITDLQADSDRYKAMLSVSLGHHFLLNEGDSGALVATITHTSGGETYEYVSPPWFFDTEPTIASLSGGTVMENTPVTKTLSGITYYTIGSTFDVSVADLDNLNGDTYPATQLTLTMTQFGAGSRNVAGADMTGWTPAHDNTNASYSGAPFTVNQSNYRFTGNATMTARVVDWVAGASTTDSILCLIDTYGITSTATAEPFDDEARRVTSTGAAWDSASSLLPTDLMIKGGQLQVQSGDWTNHNPTPSAQSNYSAGGAATQYFYRYFSDSLVRSGGVFDFGSGTESDFGANFKVEISLNGIDWYDVTQNYFGGALTNEAGCRTNADAFGMPTVQFTLATFSTADASGIVPAKSILARVSMPSTSAFNLNSFSLTWN